MLKLEDNETREILEVDADAHQGRLPRGGRQLPGRLPQGCLRARIDYVPLHTGMPFDKALMCYLLSRQAARVTRNMEFSLIHAGLAAGAALAALPVILHLFMRQTPKHVIFPALRLIRERQKRSQEADADQELAAPAGPDGRCSP